MLTFDTCHACQSAGIVQVLEQYIGNGQWSKTTKMLPHELELAEQIIAEGAGEFRWTDQKCHRCHGDGVVAIEHVVCKIF